MAHWMRYSGPSRDIDLPATVAHRSVEGNTLMLVPGSSYQLTEDEWKHLESAHPGLLEHFKPLT